jgi:hypothetical protein
MKIPFVIWASVASICAMFSAISLIKLIQTGGNHEGYIAALIILSGCAVNCSIIAIVRGVQELN